ncbi:hypothetical protein K040078D81_10270 [Blautia hominis]|uniref:HTH merR-type domain-containing protein n=1 Tax=Blautia hominis TaxID=2025493 RepID=A0ABQ0B626_9FIRM
MSETSYSVSETAKLLDVQSHVLRFWEDELHLPINRNEMGHRYYTRYDIQVLLAIKELKKKGLALKEIGSLIPFLYKDEENKKKTAEQPQQKQAEPTEQKKELPAARKNRKASRKKNRAVQNHNPVQEKSKAAAGRTQQPAAQVFLEPDNQVPAEFMEILDRLVKERMRTLHSGEERYKKLDERIRICQKSRREVAAAMEQERQKNKKLFKKKR